MKTNGVYMSFSKRKYLEESERVFIEQQWRKLALYPSSARNSVMFLLCLHTGARASEILNLTWNDIGADTVYIRGIKGSLDREIPLPVWLARSLQDLKFRSTSDRPFNMTYDNMYRLWCIMGVKGKCIHSLRHTFALRLYQHTRDLNLVKAALGHKSIINTMIYQTYTYTNEELRRYIINE